MSVLIYRQGLVACSVCAPAEMSRDDVEVEVNLANPTGIDPMWKIDDAETFNGGEPNPCPCDKVADRLHYLMSC